MEGEAELVLALERLRELEEKLNECERTHDPAVAIYVKVCVCDLWIVWFEWFVCGLCVICVPFVRFVWLWDWMWNWGLICVVMSVCGRSGWHIHIHTFAQTHSSILTPTPPPTHIIVHTHHRSHIIVRALHRHTSSITHSADSTLSPIHPLTHPHKLFTAPCVMCDMCDMCDMCEMFDM